MRFFTHRFGLVYRILASGAVVLLVPLVGVWAVTLLAILIPTTGPAAAIGLGVRLLAQGTLIMALPVAGLLISSGLMAAWHHLEGDGVPPPAVRPDTA
jgi:hypothetical protein